MLDENNINKNTISNPKKKKSSKKNIYLYTINTNRLLKTNDNTENYNKINNNDVNPKNSNNIKKQINTNNINNNYNIRINENENKDIEINDKEKNELPYFKAYKIDNRNFFKILFSIFLTKIDLLENIFSPEEYSNRFLLFSVYLLSLYLDLLMNCLLYNDYAVSQKYHCNGNLEFITSFIISLLSNIFSFILSYFINYLGNFSDIIDMIIREIKRTKEYLLVIIKLFRIMKIKYYFLLILEIILGLFMVYYLFVFSAINSKSINSFLLNYLYSQIESLIYSVCISIIISLLRRISLLFQLKRLYIISMYINEHF